MCAGRCLHRRRGNSFQHRCAAPARRRRLCWRARSALRAAVESDGSLCVTRKEIARRYASAARGGCGVRSYGDIVLVQLHPLMVRYRCHFLRSVGHIFNSVSSYRSSRLVVANRPSVAQPRSRTYHQSSTTFTVSVCVRMCASVCAYVCVCGGGGGALRARAQRTLAPCPVFQVDQARTSFEAFNGARRRSTLNL